MFHPQGPTFFELMRQALSSTEKGYDLLAPKFDYTPFRTPDLIFNAFNRLIKEYGPFDSVLDICCGTGAAMEALMPYCRRRMVGLDISRQMLKQAEKNLRPTIGRPAREPTIEFVRGQALEMPFKNKFDLVVSFSSFGHILLKDQSRFIGEIHQSLRTGGRFAFVTSEMPSMVSTSYWVARGFNGAMHIRNLLIHPPFVMYYLTFLWPAIEPKLKKAGFDIVQQELFPDEPKLRRYKFVVATKPAERRTTK